MVKTTYVDGVPVATLDDEDREWMKEFIKRNHEDAINAVRSAEYEYCEDGPDETGCYLEEMGRYESSFFEGTIMIDGKPCRFSGRSGPFANMAPPSCGTWRKK
jgi:hypothetical protein